MKIELAPDEKTIGTWMIFYLPPNGGKYNGKLTVTNKRLLYDAKFDASFKGIVEEAVFIKWGSEGFFEIDKSDIKSTEVTKKLLSKRCTITLNDGSLHAFDYGALNVDKCAEAIDAR